MGAGLFSNAGERQEQGQREGEIVGRQDAAHAAADELTGRERAVGVEHQGQGQAVAGDHDEGGHGDVALDEPAGGKRGEPGGCAADGPRLKPGVVQDDVERRDPP